jgi:hypothetical protein
MGGWDPNPEMENQVIAEELTLLSDQIPECLDQVAREWPDGRPWIRIQIEIVLQKDGVGQFGLYLTVNLWKINLTWKIHAIWFHFTRERDSTFNFENENSCPPPFFLPCVLSGLSNFNFSWVFKRVYLLWFYSNIKKFKKIIINSRVVNINDD